MNQDNSSTPNRKLISGVLDMSTASTDLTELTEALLGILANHLKYHANDGMSLYVFATKRHHYPVSAANRQDAFYAALCMHNVRGLPPSNDWQLVYEYPDGGSEDGEIIALLKT